MRVLTYGVLLLIAGCTVVPKPLPRGLTVQQQIDAVYNQLTLEEKVALTHGSGTMTVTAIPDKGLLTPFEISDGSCTVRPELNSWTFFHRFNSGETSDMSTLFPSLSHLAQTWNVDTARAFGEAMGSEARARGKDMLLTPGINIARTPLCGRNWEYLGEDPHLTGEMAVRIVQGIQSQDVAACVKHFALNSQEWNRNEVDGRPDETTLREIYLPAFEKVVREGKTLAVMNAYNRIYGQYASHSDYLNNTILKGEWDFKGLLVTDWGSLHDTVEGALGGTDLEMNAGLAIRYFTGPLEDAVEDGEVPEARLNDMVCRMLYVQAVLHKLDGVPRAPGKQNAPEHQALARDIAAEGMVLLKNDQQHLPLDVKRLKTVVVVGQLAREKHANGGWSAEGKPPYEVTPLAGLQAALPGTKILYYTYPHHREPIEDLPETAITLANPDVHGEIGMREMGWSWVQIRAHRASERVGEGFMKTIALPKGSERPDVTTTWRTTFRAPESGNGFLVFTHTGTLGVQLNGVPQAIENKPAEKVTTRLPVLFTEGQEVALEVSFCPGNESPTFDFGWTRPSDVGGSWIELFAAAKKADAVLLFTGTRHGDGVAMECEGADRPNMKLPMRDNFGIRTLLTLNPNAIVILNAGSPVEMPWLQKAKTLLLMSYAGQEAGHALADVLLGKRAPSGRLAMTWAEKLEHYAPHALNDYHETTANYKEGTAVGYRWARAKGIDVPFAFGYGLTYTTFDYSLPAVNVEGDKIAVTFTVTNTGTREGAAVPQLYVGETWSMFERGREDLRAFTKVFLAPGETKTVTLTLKPRDFARWDTELHGWRATARDYTISLKTSAVDAKHTVRVELPPWEEKVTP